MPKITVRHPRNKNYLYLGLGFLVGLTLIVIFLWPENWLNLFLFYFSLSLTTYNLSYFIFNQKLRAIRVSAGLVLFFLLRHLGLTHFIYPILISAVILSLEVKFNNK